MRALILMVLLPVALAGDGSPLDDAARLWASDTAGVREAASRAVARHLARELAPLVEAMKSDDPEVRLRALAALEAFLPSRSRAEPDAPEPAGQQLVVVGGAGGGGQIRVFVGAKGQVLVEEDGVNDPLRKKGLAGRPVDDELLRAHLGLAAGRGFAVTEVEAGSEAERLGLKRHDILLAIDGRRVMQVDEVLQALQREPAEVRLLRGGKVLVVGRAPPAEGR